MRCLIIYYSLYNTTHEVAESIRNGLTDAGVETVLCRIGKDKCPDLEDFDLLGIGTPVYYFNIPVNVKEYIERLPDFKKIRTFAFLMKGSYIWNASDKLNEVIKAKGTEVEGWYYSFGAGRYYPYNKLGCLGGYSHPNKKDLEQARSFGFDMAKESVATEWAKLSAKPPLMYRFEQKFLSHWMIKNCFQKLFRLNRQKCIKCGLCIKGCPTNNISIGEEGYPKWNRSCNFCISCESRCPNEAIHSFTSMLAAKPVLRYNVWKLRKDPQMEKVRVRCSKGKMEILGNFDKE